MPLPNVASSAAAAEDSNLSEVGGLTDRAVRKAAADTEPAWRTAGLEEGVQVWRIEKFEVKAWPESKFGKFHTGDSYVVLHAYIARKEIGRLQSASRGGRQRADSLCSTASGRIEYKIYYWLGDESTVDEMGTAAYKTVELCDYFDGRCRQYREAQGEESPEFLELFPNLEYLPGGIASGFRQVISDCFEACLYQIRKTANRVIEKPVTLSRAALNQGDCFILDTGRLVYVWHGSAAHPLEKYEANAAAERVVSRRRGQAESTHLLDDRFWSLLGGKGPIKGADEASDDIPEPEFGDGILYKLTDESGKMEMFEVARRHLSRAMLDSDNVMILDRLCEICVWIGADASLGETRSALWAAYNFLKTNRRDLAIPIHMYKEGQQIRNKFWNQIFVDRPVPQPKRRASAISPSLLR